MNLEAESINRWLTGTRRAIQALTHRRRGVSEKRQSTGARLARPALLIVILAITAGVPAPASARGERESRMFVRGAPPTRVQGWQPRAVNPLVPAPHSAAATSTLGPNSPFSGLGSSLVGSTPVGNGPSTLAINPATHTIYVANGYNTTGPSAGGNTVSVIDARRLPGAGRFALQGAVADDHGREPAERDRDRQADRHRLRDQLRDNTVSVFNGATCNARTRRVAGRRPRRCRSGWGRSGSSPTRATTPCTSPNFGNGDGGTGTARRSR